MGARLPRRFGPYVLLDLLGEGGIGTAHLARPIDRKRGVPTPCVIKRLHQDLGSDAQIIRRFEHEAKIAVSVDSPHVVKVFDVGTIDSAPYIAMEYICGWQLSRVFQALLEARRFAPIPAVVELVVGGLTGLGALHRASDPLTGDPMGVVHRDVSPRNLIVDETGKLRLIDLGLGKSNVQDWKTRTGLVMGSPGYMAPEQTRGERVDHRADLYAMATVLYECLVLQPYIPRGERIQMLRAMEKPKYSPPSRYRPNIPPELEAIVEKGLSREPEDRFPSAAAFIEALGAAVPEPPDRSFGDLVRDLLGDELRRMKAHVDELLAEDLEHPELIGKDRSNTVVFAHRSGVLTLREDEVSDDRTEHIPARMLPPASEPKEVQLDPTLPVARAASPKVSFATVRRGVPPMIVLALLLVAIAGTLAVDRLLLRARSKPIVARNLAEIEPPPVVVRRADPPRPDPPPAAVDGILDPPAIPIRPKAPKAEPPPAVELAPAPDAAAVQRVVDRIGGLAKEKRTTLPNRSAAIDAILADVFIWARSKDYGRAVVELNALERRLRAIE
jgi:serine/threonine-protein kinase